MELFEITEGALSTYRKYTKDNKSLGELTARKKLTRNIMAGILLEDNGISKTYGYGSLRLTVNNGVIVYIRNYQEKLPVDQEKKEYWTEVLGLNKKQGLLHKFLNMLKRMC